MQFSNSIVDGTGHRQPLRSSLELGNVVEGGDGARRQIGDGVFDGDVDAVDGSAEDGLGMGNHGGGRPGDRPGAA